jgi:hypothetical protein
MPPLVARFRATTISCGDDLDLSPTWHLPTDVPAEIDPAALVRAHDFTLELVRHLAEAGADRTRA